MSVSGIGVAAGVAAGRDEDTKEKEAQGVKFQANASANANANHRTISSLPLTPTTDYTPYFGLEFDLAVQDYCRQRCNTHISTSQQHARSARQDSPAKPTSIKQKLFAQSLPSNNQNPSGQRNAASCKVVVSGDVAVGKTCLVNRFGHDVYSSNYQTTIGVDFDLQRFTILGQPFLMQIWDTAGLERFKCITNSYYRGCQAALLVFDMSNMSTLANVLKWKDEVLSSSKTFEQLAQEYELNGSRTNQSTIRLEAQNCDSKALISSPHTNHNSPLLFLVGTKCDLPMSDTSRQFVREQANKVASILQAELWFVSAQTGENVAELFKRVAALTFNRCILNEIQRIRFEQSTLGACLKEKIWQQQKELWFQSSKLIRITKKKDGDERRTRCVNVQCVIK